MTSPFDLLLPHQRPYHDDKSRFKAWIAARQIGKSFTSAAEPVADCYKQDLHGKKIDWVTLSAGERQALEWLDKARRWTEVLKMSVKDMREERHGGSEALLRAAMIVWPNGSRVIALPANANTARGYSANVTLDEFAFHEDPDAIWRAVYPIISNPLRGDLKMRVMSSPNGQGNKFHHICTANKRFSVHKTDIYQAAAFLAAGRENEWIEELREGMTDPDGWAQEFECLFVDSASILLPYDLIAQCESDEATTTIDPAFWSTPSSAPVDLGIDFGRKRDLTTCWASQMLADAQVTREVLELRDTSTPEQLEILRPRIRKARRVCFDYTGPGIGMGDFLVKEFGEWNPDAGRFGKIELCTFTQPFKQELFLKLKMSFEQRRQRIPISRVIREDLHSMHRIVTATGSVSYRAPHTEDGHADRCTANALCVRAASLGNATPGRIIAINRSGVRNDARKERRVF